ncbi:YlqD family protein [Salipaludibacillus agaradhaerens]|uniref:YlqD family protein n=1 Tax=Salipaludibacillus agaradhaerens TaxID=76935 RepID=UPI0009982196|nr:YlqD family protein [Salipaludibacillus agaradhaerens]MCR6107095.1 YlqD family protein [Salipaludibacillus agaradhaerens]MCR6111146.1 YlqD family protein [Bacillus sp. A301a_S52]MCR6119126.1 YlqD family protein [Salipaludibacillus agaradhaerens]UJW58176.1 YlqD family protein [Bacillus sp. A116_S68]
MEIIKKVVVKQILTDESRTKLKEQFLARQYQITKELKQLEFVLHKKMKENTSANYQASLKESFNKETARRKERLRQLELKLGQLDELELGAELREGTIQMIEQVEEGDNWEEIMKGTEIVIKDGMVHELRHGGVQDD